MMHESLQEVCSSRGVSVRIDREAGVLRGVKILGLTSKNGRSYPAEALARAVGLYEGAKVNVNHPRGAASAPRDYQDRIGVIRGPVVRHGEGLYADFHFNPKHALAEQLVWDAEHAPENVGFSHNIEARTSRRGDHLLVEEILKVQGVDLVADPATTRGLFESTATTNGAPTTSAKASAEFKKLTLDRLRAERPDLVDVLREDAVAEIERLREQVERLEAAAARHRREALVRRLLGEFQLPDPDQGDSWSRAMVSETFLEQLYVASTEADVRALVAERARLLERTAAWGARLGGAAGQPTSRDQHLAEGVAQPPQDVRGFVRAIT